MHPERTFIDLLVRTGNDRLRSRFGRLLFEKHSKWKGFYIVRGFKSLRAPDTGAKASVRDSIFELATGDLASDCECNFHRLFVIQSRIARRVVSGMQVGFRQTA